MLVKSYVNPESGRYQPPDFMKAERIAVRGIDDLFSICTSHVERCNLTIRTFVKRFARLALGFSKKLENLIVATALHVGVYNFVRVHQTLRVTPAMAAGVCAELWTKETFYDLRRRGRAREGRAAAGRDAAAGRTAAAAGVIYGNP